MIECFLVLKLVKQDFAAIRKPFYFYNLIQICLQVASTGYCSSRSYFELYKAILLHNVAAAETRTV